MRAITWFGVTVDPASAVISDRTPSAGAEISTATLSVSISTRISSRATLSPTFLVQAPMVPSVTDSPMVGTVTSTPPLKSPLAKAGLPPDWPGAEVSVTGASACSAGLPGVGSGCSSALGAAIVGVTGLAVAFAPVAGLAAPLAGAGLAAPFSSTAPSFWPAVTVAPSSAAISPRTPSAGAPTSRLTLSVSSSTSTSSFFTASPGFLVQRATVASLTDSPRVGARMSLMVSNSPGTATQITAHPGECRDPDHRSQRFR